MEESGGSGDSASSLDKRAPRQCSSDSSDEEPTPSVGRPTSPATAIKRKSPGAHRGGPQSGALFLVLSSFSN